ncbi:fimbrial protein [Klebsiella sp. RHBSTW-00484]|uniref:fimbrial protein n=1 Tax=unclassified Klebsiella TaxID=2608929 RepID=UPI0015E55382|nr:MULTISPECIES: fimbrial protein [unclassified Klebsiella]MBA7843250.1 fimbrial protein [Klebsiella sp. RHBSTW-00465]QLO38622.1 fimbrial protein [Klebsiella sp. RHBSTW-00484]QLT78142.1 fimbrial protein [Klebsiella sp. RHBSTW-00464]
MIKNNTLRKLMYGMALGLPSLSFPLQAANITSTQFTITGVLEAKTCSFTEATQTINLPDVNTRSLATSNGIHGKTEFSLTLNCSGGVSGVSITPSGTAVGSGDRTLFINTASARNVGLRLLDNSGKVLTPDGQSKVTFSFDESGGKYTFAAGYAGTGTGRVSGGSFQTVVTFSLSYS